MEALWILLAIFLGPAILRAIWESLTGGSGSTESPYGETTRRGSISVRTKRIHDADHPELELYQVQAKTVGQINMGGPTPGRLVTSILDVTDGEERPVYSMVEDLQESASLAYQAAGPAIPFPAQFTMTEYVDVGMFAPEILAFPEAGMRKIRVTVRLLKGLNSHFEITEGTHKGPVALGHTTLTLEETGPGYLASARLDAESLEVAVWLALGVAQADGQIDADELGIIRDWLKGQVSRQPASRQGSIKEACNKAMLEAHETAVEGEISLSNIARRVKGLGDERLHARVFELGYKVLSADGEASPSELALLDKVAQESGVDPKLVARLRDVEILKVAQVESAVDDDLPGLLGFDPTLPPDQIRKHLRGLHKKWNARSSNAKTSEERERVQFMLDCIAKAMTKYAS